MTPQDSLLPVDRFLATLNIVQREGEHLAYSWNRLYTAPVDVDWVNQLPENPEAAERLEAFVSRFGRMQDTIADKLLPRWLMALAETPGSQIEILNRAERLGTIESVQKWLEARKLRNRLVHEYMEDIRDFSEALALAREYSLMLLRTYNCIRDFCLQRMELAEESLPPLLSIPNQQGDQQP